MTQYCKLADIYDFLVAGIDYEEWADYIEEILRRHGLSVKRVADLACGTGNTTLPLAARGYEVYGIDLAPAMLAKAQSKLQAQAASLGAGPCFLEQDMRELSLPVPMDLITCYHDGLNYITSPPDLGRVFRRVFSSLPAGRPVYF